MTDQDLPEASHAGSGRSKQIVFLFMSAVVVAVVIFLLGVSVGRGVRSNVEAQAAAQNTAQNPVPADPAVAASAPPAQTAPSDLNYHDSLRSGAPPPAPAGDKPPSAAPPPDPAPGTPPPAVNESAPAAGKKPAPATAKRSEYFVQVGAYRTLGAAQNVVKQVKSANSGYSVSTVTMPESAPPPRFKVMVGPYASADDAKAVIARLKKQGFQPFLKR